MQPLLGLSRPNKRCIRERDLSDEINLVENIRTFEQNRKELWSWKLWLQKERYVYSDYMPEIACIGF